MLDLRRSPLILFHRPAEEVVLYVSRGRDAALRETPGDDSRGLSCYHGFSHPDNFFCIHRMRLQIPESPLLIGDVPERERPTAPPCLFPEHFRGISSALAHTFQFPFGEL